jgi:hypothetical protein
MDLLHRTVRSEECLVAKMINAISNGDMTVETRNLDEMPWIFGMRPTVFDLHCDDHGVIEFIGLFVVKWSMYDSTESWEPFQAHQW